MATTACAGYIENVNLHTVTSSYNEISNPKFLVFYTWSVTSAELSTKKQQQQLFT